MIRLLTSSDTQTILDFCYLREEEHLFVIGSFGFGYDPFAWNRYVGLFEGGQMVGLGTFFGRHKNLTINVDELERISEVVEAFSDKVPEVRFVTGRRKYSEPTYQCLREQYGKTTPKKVCEETIYELPQADLVPAKGSEPISIATDEELREVILLERIEEGEDVAAPIPDDELEKYRVVPKFVLKAEGQVVSTANIHGRSKTYFQIGGVLTHRDYRGKGYGKQVVSHLCQHYFAEGLETALLFTDNDNIPAQKLYASLGFQSTGAAFMIVEY